ncbi:MAG: hypothetical protein U0746_13710 [Gemmataceae bacterium]
MRTFRTVTPLRPTAPASPAIRPRLRGLDAEVRRYAPSTVYSLDIQRRAAVVVLTAIAVSVATQAIFSLAFDRLPGVRDPLYADKAAKLRLRIVEKPGAQVVVQFGSSRTSNALRGLETEPLIERSTGQPSVVFNFGIPAAGPIIEGVYLRRWLNEGNRPSLVLMELFPAQMASQTPQPMESYFANAERFTPEETPELVAHGFPATTFCNAPRLAPLYTYRLPLLGRLFPLWSPWNRRYDSSRGTDATGWMRAVCDNPTPDQRRDAEARATAEYGDLLRTLRLDGPAAEAIRESLSLCREYNVRAAVVVMPEGPRFRALYPRDARERVGRFLQQLERDFGSVVINARGWLDDDAFIDSHHMLPSGASAFSTRLAGCVAPLLREGNASK